MQRDRALRAIDVMATCIADGTDEVASLRAAGFAAPEARVIADVFPEAFAAPAMEDLGVIISDTASARNSTGQWTPFSLADCSIYRAALAISREHRSVGTLEQSVYRAIAERSALVNTVNKALNAGADVRGGTLSVTLIGATIEDLADRPWYSRLWRPHAG